MNHLKLNIMAAAACALVAISSCDNEDLNIGQTLTNKSDKLAASTTSYEVTTRTIVADSVLALAADCYLGRVRDPETGTDVTSEFTTQLHLLETTYIFPEDEVISRYDNRAAADSCEIILYLDAPSRQDDSLQAMKMNIAELAMPMSEGKRYYSNFSPVKAGMLRRNGLSQDKMFSYANLGELDYVRTDDSYQNCIRIPLNKPYTATDGTLYNNYGTYIMRQYYDHHDYFANSYIFTHQLCPGFLFQITDGLGFHSKVTNIGLRTFYTVQGDSSIFNARLILAGTKEVLQTTHITNDHQTLNKLAQETQHTYLKTPAGLFTEVTIPVTQIKQDHEGDSLLAAKITFQRLNSQSTDSRILAVPTVLLMVQKDSLKSFFENSRVPDNITSYYTAYNNPIPTSSNTSTSNNTYTFNNISSLITTLWRTRQQGLIDDPQWEAHHPDWNKMVLVPITYTTSTSTSTLASVHHDMSLSSTRLVGGPDNPNEPIRINVVYAKFQ
ncbi:MAG: DUF4270 domain-containing protein [Prevotella sp.]|nr:DUF4270 domain-containing protein [Prevotella sp.]